jgi:hypothetical protein
LGGILVVLARREDGPGDAHGNSVNRIPDLGEGGSKNNPVNFAILRPKQTKQSATFTKKCLPPGAEKNWLPPNPTGMSMFPRIPAELFTTYPVASQE